MVSPYLYSMYSMTVIKKGDQIRRLGPWTATPTHSEFSIVATQQKAVDLPDVLDAELSGGL